MLGSLLLSQEQGLMKSIKEHSLLLFNVLPDASISNCRVKSESGLRLVGSNATLPKAKTAATVIQRKWVENVAGSRSFVECGSMSKNLGSG